MALKFGKTLKNMKIYVSTYVTTYGNTVLLDNFQAEPPPCYKVNFLFILAKQISCGCTVV